MSDIIKFTKTIASGSDGVIIIPAEQRYQRETNLPNNWQRVRIALSLSWTDLENNNASPVGDARAIGLGAIGEFAIGLSNGTGDIGTVGNRFVGATIPHTTAMFLTTGSGAWRLATTIGGSTGPNWNTRLGDGIIISGSTPHGVTNPLATCNPEATSSFCFHATIDLTVSTANTLGSALAFTLSQSDPRVKGSLFTTLPAVSSITGGWWSAGGTPTPVGCRFLSIRSPFPLNRLRIHDMEVRQLA